MEIHRYEKLWLGASLLLIVAFVATVTYGAVVVGVEMVSASGGTIATDDIPDDPRFGDPRVEHAGGNRYDVYVVARQFAFAPAPIEVPAGSRVTFYVTSADVIHGFEVAGTNVNAMAIPGQVTEFTVEFDEPAEYGVICNEYCGAGHHLMEARLSVVPAAEWEGEGQ